MGSLTQTFGYSSLKMMDAMQPKTPDAVLAALNQHGAAVGAKKMMLWEFKHAREALKTGVYVTLYNDDRKHECARLGKLSRCFCNHLYGKHKLKVMKNGRFGKNPCEENGCKCVNYKYMFRRPEEIGQYFLTRRKGFDVTEWRPLCSCKHPHAVHDPVRTRCKECGCGKFLSNFACLSCDGKWEEHLTLYEDEELRKELGKPVGEAFYPLADVPEIQKEFLRQLDEEATKNASEATNETGSEIAKLETDMNQVCLGAESTENAVTSYEEKKKLTLPAREKPERSVRLMKEQGMLRKYK